MKTRKMPKKRASFARPVILGVAYRVERDAVGGHVGHILISMPLSMRSKWKRWPERHQLLDLLHELFRAYVYKRPIRKVL